MITKVDILQRGRLTQIKEKQRKDWMQEPKVVLQWRRLGVIRDSKLDGDDESGAPRLPEILNVSVH